MGHDVTEQNNPLIEATEDDHNSASQQQDIKLSLDYPFEAPNPHQYVQITDDIRWLRVPLPFSLDHINVYLIKEAEGWCLIDTGMGSEYTRNYWRKTFPTVLDGLPIVRLIITHNHPDHVGLASWFEEEFNCDVYMSRREYEVMGYLIDMSQQQLPDHYINYLLRAGMAPRYVDKTIEIGTDGYVQAVPALPKQCQFLAHNDTITIGQSQWQIIMGSGHSSAHISLFDIQRHLLISGDQVLPETASAVTVYPKNPQLKDHRKQDPLGRWLRSLHQLHALPGDTLTLPSHNVPFKPLSPRVDDIINNHCQLLDKLIACCHTPMSVVDTFKPIYKRSGKGIGFVMYVGEILAHLQFLIGQGIITRDESGTVDLFTSKQEPLAKCVNATNIVNQFLAENDDM